MTKRSSAPLRNPMVLRGSPYADDATDRVAQIEVPALAQALKSVGKTYAVGEALAMPETEPLSTRDRRKIIDQSILVLSELYVHRELKRTRHAVDPVTALRQLKRRCDKLDGYEFHLHIMKIFKGLRDIHTAYVMPPPFSNMVAFLPFLLDAHVIDSDAPVHGKVCEVEDLSEDSFDPDAERTVIVSGLLADFKHPYFKPGVEILSWNGMPIHEAIRRIGEEEQGSNIYAQFALGLRLMTVRWFGGSLPPSEYYVTIAYRYWDEEDKEVIREIRFPWRVILDNEDKGRVASVQAMWELKKNFQNNSTSDPSMEHRSMYESTVRNTLFQRPSEIDRKERIIKIPAEIEGLPPGVFEVHNIKVDHGPDGFKFGLVRIVHFDCSPKKFVEGFLKILFSIPQTGLLIDVRSNPGGQVVAAERVLQFLTPRVITPLPFQFLATTLVEQIVWSSKSKAKPLRDWRNRVSPAVDVGNMFSGQETLTDPQSANDIGQVYYGPIALVTNAITYSSGDIFAASFQDHEIGPVIGVDPSTGGGGANMWPHRHCVDLVTPGETLDYLPPGKAPVEPKPHYAVRRCTRVGKNQGLPIEEDGVRRDHFHNLTRDDLLGGDVDLIRHAAKLLSGLPKQDFDVGLRVDGRPIALDSIILDVPVVTDQVQVELDVDVGERYGGLQFILSVDGRPIGLQLPTSNRTRMKFKLDTNKMADVRLDAHDFDIVSGHSSGVAASFRRRILFRRLSDDVDGAALQSA